MSDMTNNEILERYSESLKKAASRAHELAQLMHNPMWDHIASSLHQIRSNGIYICESRALTNSEVDAGIEAHKKRMAAMN